jgi:hypothetical protein
MSGSRPGLASQSGSHVQCVDIDAQKVARLEASDGRNLYDPQLVR